MKTTNGFRPNQPLITSGIGYLVEYDLNGNILNADSFRNSFLKIPFVIKDSKGYYENFSVERKRRD